MFYLSNIHTLLPFALRLRFNALNNGTCSIRGVSISSNLDFVYRYDFCCSRTLSIRSSVNSAHANQPSIRGLILGILTICLALASFVVAYLQNRKMGLTHVHAHHDENVGPLHAPPPPLTIVDASVEAENPPITPDTSRRPSGAPF